MAETSRPWDGAGLERKIRAAARPWTVGDIAMVADGQWGVGAQPDQWPDEEMVGCRVAEGRRVELTVEELARAVGPRVEDDHRDENQHCPFNAEGAAVGAGGPTTAAGEDGSSTPPGACRDRSRRQRLGPAELLVPRPRERLPPEPPPCA